MVKSLSDEQLHKMRLGGHDPKKVYKRRDSSRGAECTENAGGELRHRGGCLERSYKQLYQDGHACDRWNMLHPSEEPHTPYVTHCFRGAPGALVAASDYVRALPDSISRWMPRPLVALGTDGFGRSDTRAALRDFFEVDARFITLATLNELARQKAIKPSVVQKAIQQMEINPAKVNQMIS